jgi:hypothetical protein
VFLAGKDRYNSMVDEPGFCEQRLVSTAGPDPGANFSNGSDPSQFTRQLHCIRTDARPPSAQPMSSSASLFTSLLSALGLARLRPYAS